MNDEIYNLRKTLHQHPELSGQEVNTAKRILNFIKLYGGSVTEFVKDIGGHGLAVVYEFSPEGPTIVIRCELDALPIEEVNNFIHKSICQGISHKCGHDGHMAIVAGLVF
ncbi:MAG: amidohydrolase, partial [Bacteroidota bacterium]